MRRKLIDTTSASARGETTTTRLIWWKAVRRRDRRTLQPKQELAQGTGGKTTIPVVSCSPTLARAPEWLRVGITARPLARENLDRAQSILSSPGPRAMSLSERPRILGKPQRLSVSPAQQENAPGHGVLGKALRCAPQPSPTSGVKVGASGEPQLSNGAHRFQKKGGVHSAAAAVASAGDPAVSKLYRRQSGSQTSDGGPASPKGGTGSFWRALSGQRS